MLRRAPPAAYRSAAQLTRVERDVSCHAPPPAAQLTRVERDVSCHAPPPAAKLTRVERDVSCHAPPPAAQLTRVERDVSCHAPRGAGMKSKILRKVSFPFVLDMFDFCDEKLQGELSVVRISTLYKTTTQLKNPRSSPALFSIYQSVIDLSILVPLFKPSLNPLKRLMAGFVQWYTGSRNPLIYSTSNINSAFDVLNMTARRCARTKSIRRTPP